MSYTKILKKDANLKEILKHYPNIVLDKRSRVMYQLYEAVIGQQLSTIAAASIKNKFRLYFGEDCHEQKILDTPIEQLRTLGLSYAKANYIHQIAQFTLDHEMNDQWFENKSDKEIIEKLIQIKGIGEWSVQMLLIFTLGREDVFPINDLGIQKAMINLYQLNDSDKKQLKKEMLSISEKWAPYRSYATLLLWKSLEIKKRREE